MSIGLPAVIVSQTVFKLLALVFYDCKSAYLQFNQKEATWCRSAHCALWFLVIVKVFVSRHVCFD